MKYERDTDTMHTNIRNHGVEVFASWLSEIDTTINGKLVPEGSWLATLKVTNEKLIQCINQGKLNGFSLGSVSDKAYTPKYWFINKSLNYRDIKDIEEVIPLFISFVDAPANQYGWEVMTYDAYINKNEKDVTEMTEVEKQDEMISISALERVKDLFGINKSETPVTEETEVAETTEQTADETVTALFEKLDTIIEQNNQILEAINKPEEEEVVDEEEEIEKAEEDNKEEETEEVEKSAEKEEETEDDEEVQKAEDEETSEDKKEEEDEDEVHVEKRETNMIENQNTQSHTTFYQNTGRDHLGRKNRK